MTTTPISSPAHPVVQTTLHQSVDNTNKRIAILALGIIGSLAILAVIETSVSVVLASIVMISTIQIVFPSNDFHYKPIGKITERTVYVEPRPPLPLPLFLPPKQIYWNHEPRPPERFYSRRDEIEDPWRRPREPVGERSSYPGYRAPLPVEPVNPFMPTATGERVPVGERSSYPEYRAPFPVEPVNPFMPTATGERVPVGRRS
jgi:hypothetical protein